VQQAAAYAFFFHGQVQQQQQAAAYAFFFMDKCS